MNNPKPIDPYAGNILIQPLGPILDRAQAALRLSFMPPRPHDPGKVPKHIRMHYVIQLRDFHVASLDGLRVQETIDLMLRDGYRYKDPSAAQTWSVIGGEAMRHKTPRAPAMAAVIVGHSGTGKTQAILRALDLGPSQVIVHPCFPKLVGKHQQLVWLSVDVPSSGRADDLAANLMASFDATMERHVAGWQNRFTTSLARTRRDGQKMLDEWRQVASAHFLGALHLDEVQNFFKLPTLKKRRTKTAEAAELQLSIIEDQCLKWILTLTNTWQIPIILSGTPDGVGALMKRFANTQRFVGGGYHVIPPFESADDPLFFDSESQGGFLNVIGLYQFVANPLQITRELARLILELTGGIPRLIIAFWVAAHRVAFERDDDSLRVEDFKRAGDTYLAPVKPAVAALLSKDPRQISRYEDLMQRDDNLWASFWAAMRSPGNA